MCDSSSCMRSSSHISRRLATSLSLDTAATLVAAAVLVLLGAGASSTSLPSVEVLPPPRMRAAAEGDADSHAAKVGGCVPGGGGAATGSTCPSGGMAAGAMLWSAGMRSSSCGVPLEDPSATEPPGVDGGCGTASAGAFGVACGVACGVAYGVACGVVIGVATGRSPRPLAMYSVAAATASTSEVESAGRAAASCDDASAIGVATVVPSGLRAEPRAERCVLPPLRWDRLDSCALRKEFC